MPRTSDHRVITAHVPVPMADKIEQMSKTIDRSKNWIVRQALSLWIAQEEERDQLTREAIAEVDQGHVVSHDAVETWAKKLGADARPARPRARR